MNVVAIGLGVFLIGVAAYTVSDPMTRSRSWVSLREWDRNPTDSEEKQRMGAIIYAIAAGLTGLMFVIIGLAL